jgi:hypothetical protein
MSEKKTHWKKVFNSEYLSSADLESGDIVLTIRSVSIEEVKGADGKKKECNVARFNEDAKPMILNVTNSKIVKKFTGSRFLEDWKNVPVQIYVDDKAKAFGELTEGLRIRSQQPTLTKPTLKPDTEQWKKAVEFLKTGGGKIEQITKKYSIESSDLENLTNEAK